MRKIKVIIERGKDGFAAYAEDIAGAWGSGKTVEDARKSLNEAIQIVKKYNKKENIPAALKGEYQLVYHFDVESLLNYYKGILSLTGLEKLTGINNKQINHYATGLKKPRPAQRKKIENALHQLGHELIAVVL